MGCGKKKKEQENEEVQWLVRDEIQQMQVTVGLNITTERTRKA